MRRFKMLLLAALLCLVPFAALGEGLIDVNQADSAALETLPGIGKKKAEAIVLHREEHGAFESVEHLTNVSGIGDKTLAGFRDQITVGETQPLAEEAAPAEK